MCRICLGESSMRRARFDVLLIAIFTAILMLLPGCNRVSGAGADRPAMEWSPPKIDRGPTADIEPPFPPPPATLTCPGGMVVPVEAGCPPPPAVDAERCCWDDTMAEAPLPRSRTRSPGASRVRHASQASMEMPDEPATDTAGEPRDAEFLRGRGAFTQPEDMFVDRSYPLEFIVGPTEEAVAEEAGGLDLAPSQMVYVAPIMRVTLLPDPNFNFTAVTEAIQHTGADQSATWQWNVVPLRDGTQVLHAKVEVLRRMSGGKYVTVESKARHVQVEVKVGTWQGFINALRNAASLSDVLTTLFNSWGKTLGALVTLIGAVFGIPIAIREGRKRLQANG